MEKIDLSKVKIKNLISIIDKPEPEDLLFEIANFLSDEQRFDGLFTSKEVITKTRIRLSEDLTNDLAQLENLGYICKDKNKFKIINHIWK